MEGRGLFRGRTASRAAGGELYHRLPPLGKAFLAIRNLASGVGSNARFKTPTTHFGASFPGSNRRGCTVSGGEFFRQSSHERCTGFKEEFVELHRIVATGLLIKVLPAKLPRVEWEHQRSLTPFQEADYEALKDSIGEVWRGRPANARSRDYTLGLRQ